MARYYPTEDLPLNIARGLVKGTSHIHKFGAVPAMSQSKTGTVWDINDTIYPWSAFDTSNTIHVTATAADNNKTILISGLDEGFNPLEETVTIDTSKTTNTTNVFARVFRAYMTNGSTTNDGDITLKTNGANVARISANAGQTLMAVYTIPHGHTGFLMHGTMSAQSGADATGNMFVRYGGQQSFRVGHSFEVSGAGGHYNYDFSVPIPIPANSDIDVRATTRSNNGRYTAAFDIILIKTGLDGDYEQYVGQ